jgi:hypothetical protein
MSQPAIIKSPNEFTDPQPQPLAPETMKPEPYPIKALGAVLGDAAHAIANGVQVSPAMAGQSVLAAAALAAQPFANVVIDGRIYPLNLFCLTISESGNRKSGTDGAATKPHTKRQRELFESYKDSFNSYLNEREAFNTARQEVLKAKRKEGREEIAKALLELGAPPEPPLAPTLICQEPTLEGLQKSFAGGQSSQGLFSDEGGTFFGGHAMNRDNAQKSIAGLSTFWDGKDIHRLRAGEGESMSIKNPRLSIHLMVQPVIAQKVLSDELLSGQGFLARFLLAAPQSIVSQREYQEVDITTDRAVKSYHQLMTRLLEAEQPKDLDGTLSPNALQVTGEAKALWVDAYNEIELALSPSGAYAEIKPTAAKIAEQIARIAGVLTIIDDRHARQVTSETMSRAIVLGDWYLTEALRLTKQGNTGAEYVTAQEVIQWIISKGIDVVTVNQVNKGTRKVKSAQHARETLRLLEENGWLIPLPSEVILNGQKTREAWRINRRALEAAND